MMLAGAPSAAVCSFRGGGYATTRVILVWQYDGDEKHHAPIFEYRPSTMGGEGKL